eukprot:ANDGO_04321.mRNA.1 hypothetical protein CAOG_07280
MGDVFGILEYLTRPEVIEGILRKTTRDEIRVKLVRLCVRLSQHGSFSEYQSNERPSFSPLSPDAASPTSCPISPHEKTSSKTVYGLDVEEIHTFSLVKTAHALLRFELDSYVTNESTGSISLCAALGMSGALSPYTRFVSLCMRNFAQNVLAGPLSAAILRLWKLSEKFSSVDIDVEDEEVLQRNLKTLCTFVDLFADKIVRTVQILPSWMLFLFHQLRNSIPETSDDNFIDSVCGFLFHHFFCLAIVRPHSFDILNDILTSKGLSASESGMYMKRAVYISKIIQKASLSQQFGSTDPVMTPINPQMESLASKLRTSVQDWLGMQVPEHEFLVDIPALVDPLLEIEDFQADLGDVVSESLDFYVYMCPELQTFAHDWFNFERRTLHLFSACERRGDLTGILCRGLESLCILSHYNNVRKAGFLQNEIRKVQSSSVMRFEYSNIFDRMGVVVLPRDYVSVETHARNVADSNALSNETPVSPASSSKSDRSEHQVLKDFARDSFLFAGRLYSGSDESQIKSLVRDLGCDVLSLVPVSRTALGGDSYDSLMWLLGPAVCPSFVWTPNSHSIPPIELFVERTSQGPRIGAICRMSYRAVVFPEHSDDNSTSDASMNSWFSADVTTVRHLDTLECFSVIQIRDEGSALDVLNRTGFQNAILSFILEDAAA